MTFPNRFPCHVTVKVRSDVPSLRTSRFVREFERSLEEVRRRADFRVCHYSLQGNHAHFVIEAAGRDALGRGMKSLTARLARAVNRAFQRSGPVLADRYHARVLRTPREVRNALRYVLLNSAIHAGRGGRNVAATVDPASSARWFDGWRRNLRRSSARDGPAAVAPPRTWMLRLGWRRHGLLDPREVPG